LQANVTNGARHEGFRSGQAWALEWLALTQLCETAGAGLRGAIALLDSVESLAQPGP